MLEKSINTSCIPFSSNENLQLLNALCTKLNHVVYAKRTFLANQHYIFSVRWTKTNSFSTQSNTNSYLLYIFPHLLRYTIYV